MDITINLIPEYKKEEIKQAKQLKIVIKLGIFFFVSIVVFCGLLYSMDLTMDYDLRMVQSTQSNDVNKIKYDQIKDYDNEFGRVNGLLDQVAKVQSDQLYWSNLLRELSTSTNMGIALSGIGTKNLLITIKGKAASRDNLLGFKESLEKNSCFSDVTLPLSNLVSQENIDFIMELKIKEECLKK